jgi:hypothetical protein
VRPESKTRFLDRLRRAHNERLRNEPLGATLGRRADLGAGALLRGARANEDAPAKAIDSIGR